MSSATQIGNLALSKLGDDDQLVDLNTDSRAARAVLAVFDAMRDAVLRAHPWTFAMTRAALPASTAPPAFGFANSFPLPADFIRFVEPDDDCPYQVESGAILTDDGAPLNIRYIRRVTDTGTFDPLFVEALACRIASQIAMRITGSATIKQAVYAEYLAALNEAKATDGVENPPDTYAEDYWLLARESDV